MPVRASPEVLKIVHNVALNFHPAFIPLNQLLGAIYRGIKVRLIVKRNIAIERMIFNNPALPQAINSLAFSVAEAALAP